MKPKLFLSYRREDTPAASRLIYEALSKRLGKKQVFFDIDSIPPGEDFLQYIEQHVRACHVLVAVIGANWVAGGRIWGDKDFVRIEIELALRRYIPVLPVFTDSAAPPPAEQVPDSLRQLLGTHGLRVDFGRDFEKHMVFLAEHARRLGTLYLEGPAGRDAERERRRVAAAERETQRREKAEAVRWSAQQHGRLVMAVRSVWFKIVLALAGIGSSIGLSAQLEAERVDKLDVPRVDLAGVPDGVHVGVFPYQEQSLEVKVTTRERKIGTVEFIKQFSGEVYRRNTAEIVDRVIKDQGVQIPLDPTEDVLRRAHRKASLLAIQRALTSAAADSEKERPTYPAPLLFLYAFYAACLGLGARIAGYTAFRTRSHGMVRVWVGLEDIASYGGAALCGLALLLALNS